MKARVVYGVMFLSILAGAFCLGRTTASPLSPSFSALAGPEAIASNGPQVDAKAFLKSAESFRAVAKTVGPAVVTIKTRMAKTRNQQRIPFGNRRLPPGMPEEFLAPFGFQFEGPQSPSPQERGGVGSGFIIDKQGHILTNNHVIQGAGEIEVLFPEEESEAVPAELIGTDPRTDIAVLKLKTPRDLQPIEWADSTSIEVGDAAIAIGSPFMLTHSVTAGIVSAKGRNASMLMGNGFGYEMIQTDAAINPGNSGGPLCTIEGKVMGVNTAIYTQSGGSMGIGFAIPSNLAKQIAHTLIRDRKVVRGWLGVAISRADKDLLKDLGLDAAVLINEVQEDSPAEKAGIRAGDVVYEVGSQKVGKTEQLQTLIAGMAPGQSIRLKVLGFSDRKKREVEVRVGTLTDPAPRG
jgi:serine protease Do